VVFRIDASTNIIHEVGRVRWVASLGVNESGGLAIDGSGNLLVTGFYGVVKMAQDGSLTTVAGGDPENGTSGFSGDGGPATDAEFNSPGAVVTDSNGDVFVPDYQNHRIRKFTIGGDIDTVVGSGTGCCTGTNGDGGPANEANLYFQRPRSSTQTATLTSGRRICRGFRHCAKRLRIAR
jgi:hypothetical protein